MTSNKLVEFFFGFKKTDLLEGSIIDGSTDEDSSEDAESSNCTVGVLLAWCFIDGSTDEDSSEDAESACFFGFGIKLSNSSSTSLSESFKSFCFSLRFLYERLYVNQILVIGMLIMQVCWDEKWRYAKTTIPSNN
ncbi:hypothetical protein BpHYR1_035014 [Brachionus plicatilis]|uniref:Uncharacterized protein n=1 Tax=Brachionus plicatilis TaxID=10195 RepID=A0A3M7SK41_BRAPC|nr:hypothetical protein BpHYR1_035014 [Brachionus plicatilis]